MSFRFTNLTLFTTMLFGLLLGTTRGDVTIIEAKQGDRTILKTYRISFTPAAESAPAFKYRLMVPPENTIAGNSITHYLRSLGENSVTGPIEFMEQEFGDEIHDWYKIDTPDKDVPIEKLGIFYRNFEFYVSKYLRRATRCRNVEWGLGLEDLRGKESIEFLLPSVQQTRWIARVLQMRTRYELLTGDFDKAIESIGMTYKLGRDVSEMGLLVSNLIGITEVQIGHQGMLRLIGTKNSPNMYWALAEIPNPVISIQESLRLERSLGNRFFSDLENLENEHYSKEHWKELLTSYLQQLDEVDQMMNGRPDSKSSDDKLFLETKALRTALGSYSGARKRLVERGFKSGDLERMSVSQVILVDAAHDYRNFVDDIEKSFYVPLKDLNKFEAASQNASENSANRLGAKIASTFSPALSQVRFAETRVQVQLNALMAIEAIRNHYATKNEFPSSLDELELPIRSDNFTGQPMKYKLENNVATIEHGATGSSVIRYEIVLAKGNEK